MMRARVLVVLLAVIWFGRPASAEATPFTLIVNGGFESGLAGWTTASQAGSSGAWYSQTGTLSPLTGLTVTAPPQGSFAAMTDNTGPGSHVIYQDFVVPMFVTQATLSFRYLTLNQHTSYCVGPTPSLDYTQPCNQYVRIDIINPAVDSNPFTVSPAALVGGGDTDYNTAGYELITPDITSLIQGYGGQTLRLRFGQVNNFGRFAFGLDEVTITGQAAAPIPEPGTLMLFGAGLVLVARATRFRRT